MSERKVRVAAIGDFHFDEKSRGGLAELFDILRRESARDPGSVDVFFSSHPAPQDRIAQLQAEIARRQQQMQRREIELAIVQQVRNAARQVEMSFQRVQATQAALNRVRLALHA